MALSANMEQYLANGIGQASSMMVAPLREKDFWRDIELCKKIIDAGVRDHFILLENSSLANVKRVTRTKLADIEDVFGEKAYSMFNFAFFTDCSKPDLANNVVVLNIHKVRSGERKQLRSQLRFVPQNCYVCQGTDGNGLSYGLPFVQNDDGTIKWLHYSNTISRSAGGRKPSERDYSDFPQEMLTEKIIDTIPDLMDCNIAKVNYKGVDAMVPISRNGAKVTFRNRDREDGVKRRLVHTVTSHSRSNMIPGKMVDSHVRGTSSFTMNGVKICLFTSLEQAILILNGEQKRALRKRK